MTNGSGCASPQTKIYRSPLFYVGDKFKLIREISQHFPTPIKRFIEPFAGGGSVFLNVNAEKYLLNDIDPYVYRLHTFLMAQASDSEQFFKRIDAIIDKYELSRSYREDIVPDALKKEWKKTYYAKFNRDNFYKLRDDFNNMAEKDMYSLYVLLIYGFNRMLRFNAAGKYNLPVGNVDFNPNVVEALKDYFAIVRGRSIKWSNLDYVDFLKEAKPSSTDFIYVDPPYLITFSEYNKLWNDDRENELTELLDKLDGDGVPFAVSNVTHYKGMENTVFDGWAKKYHSYPIKSNYISYHDNTIKDFKEVLITNYAS